VKLRSLDLESSLVFVLDVEVSGHGEGNSLTGGRQRACRLSESPQSQLYGVGSEWQGAPADLSDLEHSSDRYVCNGSESQAVVVLLPTATRRP
jgi:hypothetical protein